MSNFPVWRTVELQTNSGKGDFDLVVVTPEEILSLYGPDGVYISIGQFLDTALDKYGLRMIPQECVQEIDEKIRYIDLIWHFKLIIRTCLGDTLYHFPFPGGVMGRLAEISGTEVSYKQKLIFYKPQALKATAGAPLQAA